MVVLHNVVGEQAAQAFQYSLFGLGQPHNRAYTRSDGHNRYGNGINGIIQMTEDRQHITIPRLDILDSIEDADTLVATLDSKGVRDIISCVNWPEVSPYRPLCSFAAAYSAEYLYIDFLVRCNYLRAENFEDLSPVSEDSCVEFFIDPLCDGHYWNFEFNCIGTVNASHRTERAKPTRLTSEEIATIRRYPSCGTRPFCELEGFFLWNVLVAIPLSLMDMEADAMPQHARCNFYKCASATSEPHYLSWAPINTERPDFHRPDFFGKISFNDI